MNAILEQAGNGASPSDAARSLLRPLWLLAGIAATLGVIYGSTFASIVAIWLRSETFVHGFLIVPVSAWLIWKERARLRQLTLNPNASGMLLLAALGMVWLLATLADVQVTRQYAAVAMIPAAAWAVLGTAVVRSLAFPLGFLLLAVPFGDAFVPFLIDLTADATIRALQLTGIPVYREGNNFTIPSGSWSVVEACSGLRYLIASVTLGSLYAYLTYRTLWRRTLFILLSILVPIVANSARAYMIVMIGHLSSMKLAVGVDHLIYGWLFFGLVMLLMFWIGARWREDDLPVSVPPTQPEAPRVQAPAPAASLAPGLLAALVIALAWPAWAYLALTGKPVSTAAATLLPAAAGNWTPDAGALDWQPAYVGNPAIARSRYRQGERRIELLVAHYPVQERGAGLVTHGNGLTRDDDPVWNKLDERLVTLDVGGQAFTVRQAQLRGAGKRVMAWRWYAMKGMTGPSPYLVKARLAWNRLLAQPTGGAEFVLLAEFHDRGEEATAAMQAFLEQALPSIREVADHAWND